MTREEKLEMKKKIVIDNYFKVECDVNTSIKEAFTKGFELGLEKAPTQRWIPVSERLPQSNRLVVCYITTGATETYFLAFWNDIRKAWEEGIGGCRLLESDLGYKVIAWQPLPQPFTAESEVRNDR